MTDQQKIDRKISENRKIEESRVKLARRSVFEFVKEQIESGERRSIRIPKCGLFSCKPRRVLELEKRNLLDTTKNDRNK